MPGIRLTHPTLRSGIMTVATTRPYQAPLLCSTCACTHEFKTYHLTLDSEGATIVSTTVYDRLREAGLPATGLEFSNEVSNPPAQTLDLASPKPTMLRTV